MRPPYFLYAGNAKPYKNLPGLLEAYAHFLSRFGPGEPPGLVLVGPPDRFRAGLLEKAEELGVRSRVILREEVRDAELAGLMVGSTAFCFPSLAEGFGLPVLEALSLGVAVITSNVASLPEAAGEAALLVNPTSPEEIGEAMLRVVNETGLRERLMRAGPEQAARFDREKTIRRLMHLYRQAAGL